MATSIAPSELGSAELPPTSKHLVSLPSLIRASVAEGVVPDDLEDVDSVAHSQLLSFTSQSLEDLRSQPSALSASKSSLESQLSTLCSRHVHSFVRIRDATLALPDALDRLDERLDSLIEDDLPALSRAANAFSQNVGPYLAAKDRARNLLDQYDLSLKDLLDIPRLLMTCARANHPIEALQLGTHIAKIAKSIDAEGSGNDQRSSLLNALKRECWSHLVRLREDLLRDLGARGVRLPAARRYVSLLSRLKEVDAAGCADERAIGDEKLSISSSSICLSFLRSRWTLIEELGAHEPDEEDAHTLLSAQISSWRDIVGDTTTIALALFGERIGTDTEDEVSSISLISSFGYRSIGKLDQLVARQLPKVDAAKGSLQEAFETLDSLHTQLSYAASSLSRQGLDFSEISQSRKEFEKQAIWLWTKGIKSALTPLYDTFAQASGVSAADLIGKPDASSILDFSLSGEQNDEDWSSEVARFVLLSQVSNRLLDAFEAFLSFAPLSTGEEAKSSFEVALYDVISSLLASLSKMEKEPSRVPLDIRINPLRVGSGEGDTSRLHQATLAVASRFITTLCAVVVPHMLRLLSETFEVQSSPLSSLSTLTESTLNWARNVDQNWKHDEQERSARAEEEERRRLAMAEEKRLAEEKRRIEMERQQEEERKERERKAKEAHEAELLRQEQEKKRLEAEAAARRQQEEEERKRAEELAGQRRKEEAEAAARREKEQKEAEERRRQEELIAQRLKEQQEAEEAERKRIEEAEEAERRRREEAQAAARREQAEREAEERRLQEELTAQRLAEQRKVEEAEQKRKEEEAAREREQQEAEERRRKAEEAALRLKEQQEAEEVDRRRREEAEAASAAATRVEESARQQAEGSQQGKEDLGVSNDIDAASKIGDTVSSELPTSDTGKEGSPSGVQGEAEITQKPLEANVDRTVVDGDAADTQGQGSPDQTRNPLETDSSGATRTAQQTSQPSPLSDSPSAPTPGDTAVAPPGDDTATTGAAEQPPPARPPPATNRLAEKLRKRQEERAKAAAAASKDAAK